MIERRLPCRSLAVNDTEAAILTRDRAAARSIALAKLPKQEQHSVPHTGDGAKCATSSTIM
jgi:hypothetical protein